jgi:hypothetical protein
VEGPERRTIVTSRICFSVHVRGYAQSTRGSTYVVPHARGHRGIHVIQRRMVEFM